MRAPVRTPFVGREPELDWLLERVRQAARGRPRSCLVRGEPGIGMSRLLAEFGRQALAEGLHVWSLRGSPDLQTPYLALDALMRDLETRCLSGPALAEASARWWEHLWQEASEAPGALETGPLAQEQRALSLAFQGAVLERATHGGFVLLIDDLQWLDGPSLALVVDAIGAAGEAASEEPIGLAVVMGSCGAVPGSSAEAAERRMELELTCDALALRGLSDRESETFLCALGIDPPARALASRLREAAGGNPARLERIVRELRRRGALERRGRSWISTLDPLAIDPEAGADIDFARDQPTRQALRLLGLFPAGASSAALAAISADGVEAVEARLSEAESRGFVRRHGDRFGFDDVALGRALAAEIPERERSDLHHRIARWLEASGEADPELLAHHWQHAWPAAPAERVVGALREAAERSMRARDWRHAAFQLEHALTLGERGGISEVTQAQLHYRAGLAHFRSLDGEPSRVHFERAAEKFAAVGDRAAEVRARIERTRTIVSLSATAYGSRAPDLEELERLVDTLDPGEASLRAYATAELAEAYAMARDTKAAAPLAERAVALAKDAGDDVRCFVQMSYGIVLTGALDLEGAARAYRESLRIGRRIGDAWLESLGLYRLPLVLAWQGQLDEAQSYLLTARHTVEFTGDWADYSLVLGALAGLAVARGEFEEVESLARQAVSIGRRSGYLWGAAMAISAVASARALRGRSNEASDAVALLEAPGMLAREIPPVWAGMAAVLRLRLSALTGTIDATARDVAAGLVDLFLAGELDPQVLPALCACVEIAVSVGDTALAERASAAVAGAVQRGVVFTASLDDVLSRVLGLAAAASGRFDEALARLEEALEAAERGGARMLRARIHADLANVLEAVGRTHEARSHREHAHALAERLGMEPLRAACAQLLDPGSTSAVRERPEPLRGEERRLLRGIASGLDERALTGDLLLTHEGVGRLRERVFAKIGASGNVEAAAFAHREGLVGRRPEQRAPAAGYAEIAGRPPPIQERGPRPLTVFVSDIANSSELIQRLGDEAAQALIQEHNRIVRAGLHRHGGVELQHTGDGFIASFESTPQALRCAVALQREFTSRGLGPAASVVPVRIGLHTGEVLLEEGRLFGMVMHSAARICGACEGGEILVSHDAWRAAGPELGLPADDLGPVPLRGILEPVSLHRVRWAEGASAPPV